MRRIITTLIIHLGLLLSCTSIQAETDIAGIKLADSYTLGDHILSLNGAGIRSKFVVKVYVGALYASETSHEAASLLASSSPASMQMHMLYKHVSAGKLVKGWMEGFQANLSEQELNQLQASIEKFNSLFPSLKEGDIVHMDFLPGRGTEVLVNQLSRGVVAGDDFFPALLRIWIGQHPADDALKKGLLGTE